MIWESPEHVDTWNVRPVANQAKHRRNPAAAGGSGLASHSLDIFSFWPRGKSHQRYGAVCLTHNTQVGQ